MTPFVFLTDEYTGGLPQVRAFAVVSPDGDLVAVEPTREAALRRAEGSLDGIAEVRVRQADFDPRHALRALVDLLEAHRRKDGACTCALVMGWCPACGPYGELEEARRVLEILDRCEEGGW